MSRSTEWNPKLRWLIRRMRLLRPSSRPLESPRRIAARMPTRWPRIVLASRMNGYSREREAQASPGVQVRQGERRVLELVEQPQFLLEQEGAEHRLVGLLDFAKQRELADRLLVGRLEQRPARVLDPAALGGVRALVGVPLVAADLVDSALAEAHHVKRIERDLGVGDAVADRLLIAAAHVDRDRPNRVATLAELVEERLQRLGVAARSAPYDRARLVVDDAGQVALAAAIGDLVNADGDQAGQARLVEVISDDPGDDPPDGVPADPEQTRDRVLAIC